MSDKIRKFKLMEGGHGQKDAQGILRVYKAKPKLGIFPIVPSVVDLEKKFPERFKEVGVEVKASKADSKTDTGTGTGITTPPPAAAPAAAARPDIPGAQEGEDNDGGTQDEPPAPDADKKEEGADDKEDGVVTYKPIIETRGAWFVTKHVDGIPTETRMNEEPLRKSDAMKLADELNDPEEG